MVLGNGKKYSIFLNSKLGFLSISKISNQIIYTYIDKKIEQQRSNSKWR